MLSERLFLQALFSWDEFWRTVSTAWLIVGDPRPLSVAKLRSWLIDVDPNLNDPILIRDISLGAFSFLGGFDLFTQAAYIFKGGWGGKATRSAVVYFLGYQSLGWLGLPPDLVKGSNVPYWVYAFFGGRIDPYYPWSSRRPRQHRDMSRRRASSLSEFRATVESVAPTAYDCLTPAEITALLSFGRKSKAKYPVFDPGLLLPSTKRLLVSKPAKVRRKLERTLTHPLYRLIHFGKFKGRTPWEEEKSKLIDRDVEACRKGELSIEEMLKKEIIKNADFQMELKTAKMAGKTIFESKSREIATKAYRRLHERFRRRNLRMPTPPKGWRRRLRQGWL